MTRDVCECDDHGTNVATYVCKHIADGLSAKSTPGFVCYPGEDDDGFADAWCEACEEFLVANGGEWDDDLVKVPDGLAILCGDCYLDARDTADRAGRLRVH